MNDLKYAFRQLLKNPGFTAVAVLTLALGIGANTAIFSVVNGVLLKPLPYDQPGQLVNLWETSDRGFQVSVSGGAFMDWKEHSTSFEALSIFSGVDKNLTGDGLPDRISGWQVSASFLRIFRVSPLMGRDFLPDEDQRGGKIIVLSHRLWQTRFAGNPNLLGSAIRLDGESYTVIGVLPPAALLSGTVDFLLPFAIHPGEPESTRDIQNFRVAGRLRSGVAFEQAQVELNTIKQQLREVYPKGRENWGVRVIPMREELVGKVKPILLVLLGAVSFVLLIACGNFANLLLARAAEREKEIAVRAALGAARWRIIRQLLTESELLAVLGGAAGLLLAAWSAGILRQVSTTVLPRAHEISLNGAVLTFSLGMSLVTGLIFGLMPALRISAPVLNKHLKESGRGSTSGSRTRLQSALVVSQVAMALVLVAGAVLLLKSFFRLLDVSPGFDAKNALVMDLRLSSQKHPMGERRSRFVHQITERLENLPGIEAAGLVTSLPMAGWSPASPVTVAGEAPQPGQNSNSACDWIAGSYFRAMGIPVVKGRVFTERDNFESAPRTAILNEALARRLFRDNDAVGGRILFRGEEYEVVGVVGAIRHTGLHSPPEARVYLPEILSALNGSLVVRSKVPLRNLAELVRKEVAALDPDQPVSNIRTLEQVIAHSVSQRHLILTLVGVFAVLALGLASIGLYGVMACVVTQRTHEIGIRMALGANSRDVLRMVAGHGLKLTLVGVVIGLAGASGLTRFIASQLYEVRATDPIALAGVSLLLLAVAQLACWLPARRAAKIDPMEALRHE